MMKILRRLFLFLIVIVFLCMLSQILYWQREADSRLVTFIGYSDLRLTAEYLYTHPLPTPIEHHFSPQPGTIIKTDDLEHDFAICATGSGMLFSEWIINGQRVPDWMNSRFIMCTLGPPSWLCNSNCFVFAEALGKGLNIVEIRTYSPLSLLLPLASSLPSQSVYQWAFVIEASHPTPTFTPHPAFMPPTPTP
ncbi:MAG: hypothetical protein KJ043_11640 [Anaerolineae bacterium]|nr:hypothetical protein [Anaerolineae bacterium]